MKGKDINLLIYGSGNVNPVNIVLENLKKYSTLTYHIDGLNLREKDDVTISYKHFDHIFRIDRVNFRLIPATIRRRLFLTNIRDRNTQRIFLKNALQLRLKRGIRHFLSVVEEAYYIHQHLKRFKAYDIINVHFIREENANIVALAPKECKVILSFWGSDLMANSGLINYKALLKAIERADIITVSSVEMREIFLSKFGRRFKNKIRYTFYGQNDDVWNYSYEDTQTLKRIGKELLLKHGHQADQFKYILKVGYSGFESQNHITIIDECCKLPEALKKEILLVIPMTYGADPEYTQTVEAYSRQKGLAACVLKKYLAKEEALSISFICDIMLNLRDNDGFNNAMIETLAAGKMLVSGGWLPYSELRKNKVYFHEIYSMHELPGLLLWITDNFEMELNRAKSNLDKVRRIVSGEITGPQWDKVYQEVLQSKEDVQPVEV